MSVPTADPTPGTTVPASASRTRFVLLSAARSGTTAIMDTLGRHPDAYVHGEVFLKSGDHAIRPEARAALDTGTRHTRPGFARVLLDYTPGPRCTGFKMWYGQAPGECQKLMQDPGVRKIVLSRANRLASYSSTLIARQTGIAHVRRRTLLSRSRGATEPLRFDRAEFEDYAAHVNRRFRRYRMTCRGRVFFALYTHIGPDLLADLQDFLGLAPRPIDMATHKINGSDILGRFDPRDHDLIRETLDDLGHPSWVKE